ncbi:MAG: Nramp family divalent metal transporter [Phycisphaerales bacterium]|nr:MAG: Nramp family divalent metal transporter [Phycisphaerales bacterium]
MDKIQNAPATLGAKLRFMGPGVVLAALAIGSGELILTPRSAAQFGFALLWVPILTIVYKAAFSESLARLTIASGSDVFAAFDRLPGPRHWAQYFIIIVFSLDMIGYGGIALAGGSALAGLFGGFDIRIGALLATALVPILLYTGSYPFFEKVVIAMCAVLLAGVIYTLFQIPLPGDQIARGLVPGVPEGSVATIMGLMGWVGAGTTTLLYSTWINEKIGKARDEREYRRWLSTMRIDCLVSYTLILGISFAFLAMAVATLHAQGIVPEKQQIMSTLSKMLDCIPRGRETFLVVGFFAMSSTVVSCMDGKSRAIASMLAGFSPRLGNKLKGYRIVMGIYLAVMAVTVLLGDNQPAEVINTIASMNAVVFGLLGFVLLYLDRKLPAYARSGLISKCLILIGSTVFLGVAFLKLLLPWLQTFLRH